MKIPESFWSRHASRTLMQVSKLRSDPDLVTEDRKKLRQDDPITFDDPEHAIYEYTSLAPNERYLADVLLAERTSAAVIPSDRFASESDFLHALGAAIETVQRIKPDAVADLRIAVGINEKLGREWIRFNPREAQAS